jgi:hypothetical protein
LTYPISPMNSPITYAEDLSVGPWRGIGPDTGAEQCHKDGKCDHGHAENGHGIALHAPPGDPSKAETFMIAHRILRPFHSGRTKIESRKTTGA